MHLLIDIQFPDTSTFVQDCSWLRSAMQAEKLETAHAILLIETVS